MGPLLRILRTAATGTCVLLLVAGCASPLARHDDVAARFSLERSTVTGKGYEHVVYSRPARDGGDVHVYFDGDGTPWLHGRWPAADPGPHETLGLTLAGLDPRGLYLGRPCYLGAAGHAECEPSLWTNARYGEAVVESLAQAIRALLADRDPAHVLLVGYSGGGTLAMLVAERVEEVDAVVTIAGNIDVAAWTDLHGYVPLDASLDPARRPPLRRGVQQVHLTGELDENVPSALVRGAVAAQAAGHVVELPGYDHRCCWTAAWPELLRSALDAVTGTSR